MPTNFPTSVDNFTNPTANDSLNLPSHSTQHANANDAIEAVEDYLLNGAGKTGLVLLSSSVFTTQSVIDFTNVFTSSYQNYRVVICLDSNSNSGATNILVRYLDSGGTPITVSNYFYNVIRSYGASIDSAIRQTTGDSLYVLGATGGGTFVSSFDLYKPNEAKQKGINLQSYAYNSLDFINYTGGGLFNVSTAYTGVRIYPAAGTFTGSIRVYGYKD
jgi:hypothetical protein